MLPLKNCVSFAVAVGLTSLLLACSMQPKTPAAQNARGVMYANGKNVARDDKEAVRWFRLAADQGNVDAQRHLGVMYSDGRGVPQDDKEAVKWFRLAADQGNADAQYSLGMIYGYGQGAGYKQGVPHDDKEAIKWFRLAADQGNAAARTKLNQMRSDGRGLSPEEELQRNEEKRQRKEAAEAKERKETLERENRDRMTVKWRSNVKIGDSCWVGPVDIGVYRNIYLNALVIDIRGSLLRVQYDGITNRNITLSNGVREEWVKLVLAYPISAIQQQLR